MGNQATRAAAACSPASPALPASRHEGPSNLCQGVAAHAPYTQKGQAAMQSTTEENAEIWAAKTSGRSLWKTGAGTALRSGSTVRKYRNPRKEVCDLSSTRYDVVEDLSIDLSLGALANGDEQLEQLFATRVDGKYGRDLPLDAVLVHDEDSDIAIYRLSEIESAGLMMRDGGGDAHDDDSSTASSRLMGSMPPQPREDWAISKRARERADGNSPSAAVLVPNRCAEPAPDGKTRRLITQPPDSVPVSGGDYSYEDDDASFLDAIATDALAYTADSCTMDGGTARMHAWT
jgi:hypothetical protein